MYIGADERPAGVGVSKSQRLLDQIPMSAMQKRRNAFVDNHLNIHTDCRTINALL